MEVKEILVPIDFSDVSSAALAFAKVVAEKFEAELHLLHVDDDPLLIAPTTSDAYREEQMEKSLQRLNAMFTDEEREHYHLVPAVRCGIATDVILEYVNSTSVDLIVMGAKGRGAIANILMGSVAKDLMQKAPCPVVTVRKPHK